VPFTAALAGDLSLFADTLWSATAALSESVRLRRAEGQTEVAVAVGEDAVALARPAWRRIEDAGGAATPFQTLAVAERAAQAHLRCGETPRIVVVREAGRPVVVFPTAVGRSHGIATTRFLGDPLIQYGDVLAARDATRAHIEAAWRAVADPGATKFILLRKVRSDARIAPVLADAATVVAEHEAPFVDVGSPAAAGPRDARELRRFRRRLADLGETRFEVLSGAAAAAAVREALAIKCAWLAARGLPSSVIGAPHWEDALTALACPATPLRAARLSVAGRTAAVEIGFVHGQRWCAFLGAVAPEAAKAGPGHVQMTALIDHCRAEGVTIYDLQAPADPYKRAIAHGAAVVRDHAAMPARSGWLGLLAARAVPPVKSLIALMPPALRRAILGLRG
jgi:CelD/BcsL family acetyltransferase involved in cellulose biosynthesis